MANLFSIVFFMEEMGASCVPVRRTKKSRNKTQSRPYKSDASRWSVSCRRPDSFMYLFIYLFIYLFACLRVSLLDVFFLNFISVGVQTKNCPPPFKKKGKRENEIRALICILICLLICILICIFSTVGSLGRL